jgi:septal ring factor EnvC (AmiA/AmiB activator)
MEKQFNGVMSHDKIRQNLDQLRAFIETELEEKKEVIKEQKQITEALKEEIGRKDQAIFLLEKNLKECRETTEGNRQLINKLLGDISKLQNDVDWYKRTYEKRSLLGVLREKIFRVRK